MWNLIDSLPDALGSRSWKSQSLIVIEDGKEVKYSYYYRYPLDCIRLFLRHLLFKKTLSGHQQSSSQMNNILNDCIRNCTLATTGGRSRKSFPRVRYWYQSSMVLIRLFLSLWLEITVHGLSISRLAISLNMCEKGHLPMQFFSLPFYQNFQRATIQQVQEQNFIGHLPQFFSHFKMCWLRAWIQTVPRVLSDAVFRGLQHGW